MNQQLIDEIKNLCRKADQTRSIHNSIKGRKKFFNSIITLYVTVGSAISAMLIFADIDPRFQTLFGCFLASVFIASLLPNAFNFDTDIAERTSAVHLWGKWVKDAYNFCNSDLSHLSDLEFKVEQKQVVDEYKKVMENTPQISENDFNRYKRRHLQKVAISKALDKTPFKSLRKIKKELSQKDDNVV